MEILRKLVQENYDLILFGDNQEGNALQDRDGYNKCIDFIRSSEKNCCIHMGDEMEAFWIDDPRYTPETLDGDPLAQQKRVISDLRPLANSRQLITILYGNHSHRLYPKVGNVTKSTCLELGIQYGGFSCAVEFIDRYGVQFKGFYTHGRKLIRSIADDPTRRLANEKLQLKQHLKHKMGDCLLMAKGHTHRLLVCEPQTQLYLSTEVSDDKAKIKENYTHNPPFGKSGYVHPDHRWYVNTGSFLRTFGIGITSYSEAGEYDPIELGYAVVEVRDRTIIDVRRVVV